MTDNPRFINRSELLGILVLAVNLIATRALTRHPSAMI